MNAIVFEERRGRSQKSTATQKVCLPPFLLALTLHLLWSILFIFCLLAPEGMNAIVFGEGWGRGQKVVAYSIVIFTILNLFFKFH